MDWTFLTGALVLRGAPADGHQGGLIDGPQRGGVCVAAAMDIARLTRSRQEDRWRRRSERPGALVVVQTGDDVAAMAVDGDEQAAAQVDQRARGDAPG